MKIDSAKLAQLIEQSTSSTQRGNWLSESITVGQVGSVQIRLTFTKEEDDFDYVQDKYRCVDE